MKNTIAIHVAFRFHETPPKTLFFQACEDATDPRAQQCSNYDDIPYGGQLLKWYPHHDSARPCSLICRGEQLQRMDRDATTSLSFASDGDAGMRSFESDEAIVVQLAEKVEDGTRCRAEGLDVCVAGECMVSSVSGFFELWPVGRFRDFCEGH